MNKSKKKYDKMLLLGAHLGMSKGDPIAIATVSAILNYPKSSDLLERVRFNGRYIKKRFQEIFNEIRQMSPLTKKTKLMEKGIEIFQESFKYAFTGEQVSFNLSGD